jgi:hypothetical protein
MKKENIIWLVVGGLAVYLLLKNKKKEQVAEVKEDTSTPTTTPTPTPIDTSIVPLGKKPAHLWTNEELQSYMTNTQCRHGGAYLPEYMEQKPNAYTLSLIAEAEKRGIKAKCPDYGKYPPQGNFQNRGINPKAERIGLL